jgi:perosamine synthetase
MIPRFSPAATWQESLAFLADTVRRQDDGPAVAEFEAEFARWIGVKAAHFVPSGRMGLAVLMEALNYPVGSEIIVPGFTYFAIPALLRLTGHKVVYADIEPTTFELSAATVRPLITSQTRAIIPTHLFGRTCPVKGLQKLCAQHGIDLLEDCAQSSGAMAGHQRTGSLGRAAYFTFGITKNFTTFSGGMVTTSDEGLSRRMAATLSKFGRPSPRRLLKEGGTALSMFFATRPLLFSATLGPLLRFSPQADADPIHRAFKEAPRALTSQDLLRSQWLPGAAQAAAGLRQLKTIDDRNEERRQLGSSLLQKLRARSVAGPPAAASPGGDHIFVSFAMRHADRPAFGAALRRHGVDFSAGYMSACSALPDLGGRPGVCPNAEAAEREVVHLPLYPGLSDGRLEQIANGIAAAALEVGA